MNDKRARTVELQRGNGDRGVRNEGRILCEAVDKYASQADENDKRGPNARAGGLGDGSVIHTLMVG